VGFCAFFLGIDEESMGSQGLELGFQLAGILMQSSNFILMESSPIQGTLGK
jgi:hypothetical protein